LPNVPTPSLPVHTLAHSYDVQAGTKLLPLVTRIIFHFHDDDSNRPSQARAVPEEN
jgi:hypothetical protein